jgi:hypothetical protein
MMLNSIFKACEEPCMRKLGKSVVAAVPLAEGHVIALSDLKVKVSYRYETSLTSPGSLVLGLS